MKSIIQDEKRFDVLSFDQARKLVDIFVGPEEINTVYGTTLSEEDCLLGFSQEDILNFRKHIQTVLSQNKQYIVLILVIEKDGQGRQIDFEYIGEDFVKGGEYNKIGSLVYWYSPPFWHQELRKKSKKEKLHYAWLLCSLYGSNIYCGKNPDKQIALAYKRGEVVLSYLEESYLWQTMLAAVIASGTIPSIFDPEQKKVSLKDRVTKTEVYGEKILLHGHISEGDRSHQRIDVGRVQREISDDDWSVTDGLEDPLATAMFSPIHGGQPAKTRFDNLKDFWDSKQIYKTLGIEILEIKKGYAKLRMHAQKEFLNHFDGLSGGIISQFADCAMGVALSSLTSHNVATRVLESEFLSSIVEGESIETECQVTLRDNDEINKIRNPKDNKLVSLAAKVYKSNGQIVSVHNSTFVVLPHRKS